MQLAFEFGHAGGEGVEGALLGCVVGEHGSVVAFQTVGLADQSADALVNAEDGSGKSCILSPATPWKWRAPENRSPCARSAGRDR